MRIACAAVVVCGLAALTAAGRATAAESWDEAGRRPYVSGIVGGSFASLASGGVNTGGGIPTPNTGVAFDDLFTAGGALGVALDRENGLLRLEVEGRGRDAFLGQTGSVFSPFQYDVEAKDGWSVTANAWRDFFLGDRWGGYVGGGIGGGGYRLFVADNVATGYGSAGGFAWQAGGGLIWEVTDRMTLDLGYRWFAIDTLSTPLALTDGTPTGNYTSAFGASELLLTVRVYEPFRRWLR